MTKQRLFKTNATPANKLYLVVDKRTYSIVYQSNQRKEAAQMAACNSHFKLMKQNSFNFEDDS